MGKHKTKSDTKEDFSSWLMSLNPFSSYAGFKMIIALICYLDGTGVEGYRTIIETDTYWR